MKENNINTKYAKFRDLFLNSQKNYAKRLKANPKFNKLVENLNRNYSGQDLYNIACMNVHRIESGLVRPEDLEHVEYNTIAALSAIVDHKFLLSDIKPLERGDFNHDLVI